MHGDQQGGDMFKVSRRDLRRSTVVFVILAVAVSFSGVPRAFAAGAWSALPHGGLNGPVLALAVSGTARYVGGNFTQTADGAVTNLNHIAKFDGTTWSALPHGGLNGLARALAVTGTDRFVVGNFT